MKNQRLVIKDKTLNLLSAGCSLIYGAELSDSPSPIGLDHPSQKTWISLFANTNNLNHFTVATCGVSNQGIVRKVIEAIETHSIDMVIVQWTYLNRFELRWNDETYQTFSYWHSKDFTATNPLMAEYKNNNLHKQEIATLWFKDVYSQSTAYYYYLKSLLELGNYLSIKKIPFVFFDSETVEDIKTEDIAICSLKNATKNYKPLRFDGLGFYNWALKNNYPIGKENHPLDEAHENAYNLNKNILNSKFNIKNV